MMAWGAESTCQGKSEESFQMALLTLYWALNNEWFIRQIRQRTGRWARSCVGRGSGEEEWKNNSRKWKQLNQKTQHSTFSNCNFNIRKACETFIERAGKVGWVLSHKKNGYKMGRRILYLEMRYSLKIQFILKTVNWTAIY